VAAIVAAPLFVAPDRSQLSDLWCFVLFGMFYWLGSLVGLVMSQLAGMRIHIDTGWGAVNFAIYYAIFSFLEYWSHRISHSGPFWQLHRFHHAGTSMNPMLQYRNHPGNRALEVLFFGLPAGLVSVPVVYMALIGVISAFYHVLIHADVGWRWGWIGRWVVNSPAAHRLHHSADPAHHGRNLSVLTIWDRVFGTWLDPAVPVIALGLGETQPKDVGLLEDICQCYVNFVRDLAGGVVRARRSSRAGVAAGSPASSPAHGAAHGVARGPGMVGITSSPAGSAIPTAAGMHHRL
jgi:hypothetical protein